MAYQVILEPGISQFREVESPRVRTRIIFRGTFSCALVDLRKARERGCATLDEKWVLTPLRAKQIEGNNRGGGRDDTCDHGLYVQKLESRSVPKRKEKNTRRDDQSAISRTEHVKYEATKRICQLRTNTTACT